MTGKYRSSGFLRSFTCLRQNFLSPNPLPLVLMLVFGSLMRVHRNHFTSAITVDLLTSLRLTGKGPPGNVTFVGKTDFCPTQSAELARPSRQ